MDNRSQKYKEFISDQRLPSDLKPWYALQLFGVQQSELSDYLRDTGNEIFVPVHQVDLTGRDGKLYHELRPVVTNLLFLRQPDDDKELIRYLDRYYQGKYFIVRKERGTFNYYQIPASQMREFMIMCNPTLLEKKFLTEEEARLKPGDRVFVHHGPLKGLTGRLVRQSGKYYLLKEIPGMAVMLKVTRWCCEKTET